MHWLLLAAVTNMSATFALCFVSLVTGIVVVVVTSRSIRANDAALRAREEVRSRELNQINHRLMTMEEDKNRRITYLEGALKGQSSITQE
jgi:hypothetical protein